MENLRLAVRRMQEAGCALPFSVYSSVRQQRIVNVPIIKPTLICVLDGKKKLGEIDCPPGSFVILSNRPGIDMRNIPGDAEYLALIIEFEYDDFKCLPPKNARAAPYVQGEIGQSFLKTLQQFVEWSAFAPRAMWAARRQEILQLLYHLGYGQIGAVVEPPSLSHKVHGIIVEDVANDIHAGALASRLAISESTLRRKLAAEGTNLQEIKDRARLGHGLHLIQASFDAIGRVAERCGYQSQSRFTDKFKQFYGVTPSDLRKTRMRD
ncbi:helix-turn-helix transcriptional regulator [Pseudoduganella sp. HUAS MS19]